MTVLVTTGSPLSPLLDIAARLQSVGLHAPRSTESGQLKTPELWVERLTAHAGPGGDPIAPGRAWQLAASEILLANLDAPCWGWADARNLRLLDFWADFDEDVRFLLVLAPPEQAVAAAQAAHGADIHVPSVLAEWREQLERMVAFYHRHPTRVVLSDLRSWQNPDVLPPISGTLLAWLGHEGTEVPSLDPVPSPNALLVWLATQRIAEHARELALWAQSQALMPALTASSEWGVAEASAAAVSALTDAALQRVEALRLQEAHTALSQQFNKLQAKLQAGDKTRATLRGRLGQMGSAKSAAERAREAAEARVVVLEAELANMRAQQSQVSSEQLEELKQENELLLEQMHTTQEELERYFLLAKEREEALANVQSQVDGHSHLHGHIHSLEQRIAELEGALHAAQQAAHEAQAARQHVEHERDHAWGSRAEVAGQAEALQHRIAELEGALHAAQQAHHHAEAARQELDLASAQALAARIEAETNRHHAEAQKDLAEAARWAAEHDREQLTARQHELQSQIEAQQHRVAELEGALQSTQAELERVREQEAGLASQQMEELKQENELLLEQMHTAQEELEHYFLQFKQKEEELKQAAERLDKFRQRYPSHVEWDAVEVEPTEEGGLQLQFSALGAAGHDFSTFEINLHPGAKGATLAVPAQPALLALDESLQHELVLDPWADARSETRTRITAMSTRGWRVCKALPHAVAQALAQKRMAEPWVAPLAALSKALTNLDECLRWDGVRLRNEQVNTDYEHLWLRLENASFQQRFWPSFEFRLAAANVRKGKFSGHVKYEFPQAADGVPPVFEQWFEESEDEHGPKYELRFDSRKGAMDAGAWEALSADDHLLMLALLTHVPRMLAQVEAAGRALRRPRTEWDTLNRAAAKVLLGHLGLAQASA